MSSRRSTTSRAMGVGAMAATIRLATTMSVLAAAAAALLSTLGVFSQTSIVLGVIVIGFATSWVQTGRLERQTAAHLQRGVVPVTVRGVRYPVS